MNRRKIAVPGLAFAVVAGLVTVFVAPAIAEHDKAGSVDWKACPEDVPNGTELECATVAVPLDYDKPDGKKIDVMISRLASTDPEQRRGVLMLNPGGPGGSGLSQPADMNKLGLPDSVKDSYDLIGMDTRGVGHSTRVSCGFTVEQGYGGNVPPYAPDEAAVAEQAEASKKIAEQCAKNDPDKLMPHMSTANIARDLDSVREMLGEKKISYYGASYGSALGSTYASLFPDNGDRMVIDSNLGNTVADWDSQRRFAEGMEDTFPVFAAWVAKRDDSYGLGSTPEEVRENFFTLAEQLDEKPVADADGALLRFYVFAGTYKERTYGMTAQFWQSLAESDEEAVREQVEEMPLGLPGLAAGANEASDAAQPSPYDNNWSAYLAVTCNDTDFPEDVETYQKQVAEDRETYPLFGAAGANISPCAFWNNDPVEPAVEFNQDGPQNILVLQNLRDPATPHSGGKLAREGFGDRARLVSVDGTGHGVYVYDDNPCALNTTTKYLVDGEFPESDVTCESSSKSGLNLDADGERERKEALDRLGR